MKRRKSGFTFIELLIVMTIVMVMTLTVFSLTAGSKERTVLSADARAAVAGLRAAQNSALTGELLDDGTKLFPCFVDFSPVSGSEKRGFEIIIFGHRGTSCDERPLDSQATSTTFLDGGSRVSSSVKFKVPSATVENVTGDFVEVDITNSRLPGQQYRVCVYNTGFIDEKGITNESCL